MNEFSRQVLDHGFVKLLNLAGPTRRTLSIDGHGYAEAATLLDGRLSATPNSIELNRCFDADDIDPANAARLSFEQGDLGDHSVPRTYEQDMRLAEYLLVNQHTSPLEMIQVWVEVRVPIFIDRQMVRHRTWRRNESSGRYVTLPEMWYIPAVVGGKAPNKKQGQEDNLPEEVQAQFRAALDRQCREGYALYTGAMEAGVAPEHARMALHLNHYVHWVGSVDLSNLFKFLALRTHSHAQIEARAYGEAIVTLLRPHLPGLMGLFDKHVRKAD